MSQIETIMLVALGFAVAALIALFLGRFTWRFAVGLGKQRMQRSAPSTLAELKADRDRLRAEYAMLSRKLDLRLTELRAKLAEEMAEVSRNRNRIDHMASELRQRDAQIAERDNELVTLKMQLGPLESELAARTQASQQLKDILRRRDEEIAKQHQLIEQLRAEILDREKRISSLKSEVAAKEISGTLLHPDQLSIQERIRKRVDDLSTLSRQIETHRAEFAQQKSDLASLKSHIGANVGPLVEGTAIEIRAEAATLDDAGQTIASTAPPTAASEPEKAPDVEIASRVIEEHLQAAERETEELADELRKLDAEFNAGMAQLEMNTGTEETEASMESGEKATPPSDEPVATEARPRPLQGRPLRGVANVIQLAARIRGMQKNANGSS